MNFSDLRGALEKGHFRIWAGAFFFAMILWLLVISENEYTHEIRVPIEIRNLKELRIEDRKTLGEEPPDFALVRFTGSGRAFFNTMLLKWVSDFKLVLDLEQISTEYDFYLNDYFERYPDKVVLPRGSELEYVEVVRPASIHFRLVDYMEKLVPVRINTDIDVEAGYVQVGPLKVIPDSIHLAGSIEILAERDFVETEYRLFTNLHDPLTVKVPLDLNFPRVVEATYNEVPLYEVTILADIQRIGQTIISEVPVEVINVPENLRVFASPSSVSLTITGGVDYIAEVNPRDIKVYVDFSTQWVPKQLFYPPEVVVPDDVIEWQDLSPKNIELVVTKIR